MPLEVHLRVVHFFPIESFVLRKYINSPLQTLYHFWSHGHQLLEQPYCTLDHLPMYFESTCKQFCVCELWVQQSPTLSGGQGKDCTKCLLEDLPESSGRELVVVSLSVSDRQPSAI